MRNVHERHIRASAKRVGAVLETLATDDDRLWPGTAWAPMVLDRGLEPGSRGGHDGIRYTVTAHDPGRHVEFAFDRPIGIDGAHAFTVLDLGDGTALLRHVLEGRARGSMILLWPLAVRWAHDALVEDAFDLAETALGVGPEVAARWSPWVRLLRPVRSAATDRTDVRQIETPAELLAAAGLPGVHFSDTFALRLPTGSSRDVAHWHRALLAAGEPAWVGALMAVRNRMAQGLGLETAGGSSATSPFTVLARDADTLVVGADDKHLDFRGVLRVVGEDLQCATIVHKHNATGRAYFSVVKPFHRRIVPALLRRVARLEPTPGTVRLGPVHFGADAAVSAAALVSPRWGQVRRYRPRKAPGLPPGQRLLEVMPRFSDAPLRPPPPLPAGPSLELTLEDTRLAVLSGADLHALGPREQRADFHCVTTWSVVGLHWTGFPLRDVLASVAVTEATAPYLVARAADGSRAVLTWVDATAHDVLLATHLNGVPLDARHGAPLRLVSPGQYGYKNLKHLVSIDLRTTLPKLGSKEHLRARVALQERHPSLPSWAVRRFYRLLIAPTAYLGERTLRRHLASSAGSPRLPSR